MLLDLDIEPASNGYGPKNKAVNYAPTGGSPQAPATAPQTQAPVAQTPATSVPQTTATPQAAPQTPADEKPPWG